MQYFQMRTSSVKKNKNLSAGSHSAKLRIYQPTQPIKAVRRRGPYACHSAHGKENIGETR